MEIRIGRRNFVTLLGSGAAVWPLAARAQQAAKLRRIGILMNGTADAEAPQSYVAALLQGLREFGWVEGQNLRIDVRWKAAMPSYLASTQLS
jgi:putative tryptophan/tyrosine transport system substrate-binding protein